MQDIKKYDYQQKADLQDMVNLPGKRLNSFNHAGIVLLDKKNIISTKY